MSAVIIWGPPPGLWKRMAPPAPRPSDSLVVATLQVHIVGNVPLSYLPSNCTAEMDLDFERVQTASRRVIRWVDGELRYLGSGTYAMVVECWEDFKNLLALAKVNPYARFVVEFNPEAEADFMFIVFESLRFNPQFVFRDAAFNALRGQYRPPGETVIVGGKVYREVDWRAVVSRGLKAVERYAAPELGYIASGYFTPDNDPYLWWARRFTSFTVVELPPPEPSELRAREPRLRRAPLTKKGARPSLPPPPEDLEEELAPKLADNAPRGAESGDRADDKQEGEESEIEELEVELG
mgnify:CR=1 FL=1